MPSPARKKNIALLNLSSIKPTTDETVKQQIINISPVSPRFLSFNGIDNLAVAVERLQQDYQCR
jgi:hypothetical protein